MDLTIREAIERYGRGVALAVAIVLVTVLAPTPEGRQSATSVSTGPQAGFGQGGVAVATADPGGPAEATGQGDGSTGVGPSGSRVVPGDTGQRGAGDAGGTGGTGVTGCRPDGRTDGISVYQPPCVPLFSGDNGGATARGVSADKITVVVYQPDVDPASEAALAAAGLGATEEETRRTFEGLRHYYNNHFETYGREVVFTFYKARGPNTDDEAMRADALDIAENVKAFAVFALVSSDALIEELTARGVVVLDAALNRPRSFYARTAPYFFSRMPSAEEIFAHVAEYAGKRLAGRPAQWAGTELSLATRKLGLVYLDQPGVQDSVKFLSGELARYGTALERSVGYSSDLSRAQEQASNIIAQMKGAGVTTLIFNGDLLYPIFLTQEADRQAYFPEWFTTGSGLEDITFIGRKYSQTQWAHAFGISPMYMYWFRLASSEGYREFHHGMPEAEPGDEIFGVNTPMQLFRLLFIGVHMAGPSLTPDSYVAGMRAYPATGGEPHFPLWSFTEDSPSAVEDRKEVWWDPDATCPDEFDSQGVGCMMHVDGGNRTLLGQWPSSTPKMFDPNGAVVAADMEERFPHEADGHVHSTRCRSCTG